MGEKHLRKWGLLKRLQMCAPGGKIQPSRGSADPPQSMYSIYGVSKLYILPVYTVIKYLNAVNNETPSCKSRC